MRNDLAEHDSYPADDDPPEHIGLATPWFVTPMTVGTLLLAWAAWYFDWLPRP